MLMKWFYTLWSTCPSFFFTFVKKLEILKLGKTEKLREGSVNHKNSFILLIGMLNGILWPGKRRCLPVVLLEYLFGRSTLWDLIVNWMVILGVQDYFSFGRKGFLRDSGVHFKNCNNKIVGCSWIKVFN